VVRREEEAGVVADTELVFPLDLNINRWRGNETLEWVFVVLVVLVSRFLNLEEQVVHHHFVEVAENGLFPECWYCSTLTRASRGTGQTDYPCLTPSYP
jgi:hypothetical protein